MIDDNHLTTYTLLYELTLLRGGKDTDTYYHLGNATIKRIMTTTSLHVNYTPLEK